jgi:ABC-2 type transport system permease protein
MYRFFAFVRRDALVAASYRTSQMFSLASLIFTVVPVFFVAKAIQPIIAGAISTEGGEYFAFVVTGLATFQLIIPAVSAFPTAVASGIRTGTLEIMLATTTRLPALILGMTGYPFAWHMMRAMVMMFAAVVLGAHFGFERSLVGLFIWIAVALSYLPFGIMGAALILVTRTTGPLPSIVLVGTMFLGGIYYPTHVIPSWLQSLSDVVPMTYGLRAFRRTVIQQAPLSSVAGDLALLALLTVVLLGVSMAALLWALRYARRTGTLAQY